MQKPNAATIDGGASLARVLPFRPRAPRIPPTARLDAALAHAQNLSGVMQTLQQLPPADVARFLRAMSARAIAARKGRVSQ